MGYLLSEILGMIDYFGRLRPFLLFAHSDTLGLFAKYGVHFEQVSMYDLMVGFSIVSLILDYIVHTHTDENGVISPDD